MAGRTVLVTGATGGIGKATALGLAAQGAHLAVTGRDAKPRRSSAASYDQAAAARLWQLSAHLAATG